MQSELHSNLSASAVQVMGRIVAGDPIVTISKCHPHAPLGIASAAQDFFRKKHALHLISNTWHCQNERQLRSLGRELKRLSKYLVNNHFIYLGNTQYEAWLLSRNNISSIHSSELISIDESIFRPGIAQPAGIKPVEAVYVARLEPFKRHELAGSLTSLALVYGNRGNEPKQYEIMKLANPHWIFVNHELGNGQYHRLSKEEVVSVLNSSSVGLCLSREEGAMRASMEYLLCGLPVVSTRNIGGRSRYFNDLNCIYADDSPESIANAVRKTVHRETDRMKLRNLTIQKVQFERAEFVSTINNIAASIYGRHDLFDSYTRFIGYMKYRHVNEILGDLPVL